MGHSFACDGEAALTLETSRLRDIGGSKRSFERAGVMRSAFISLRVTREIYDGDPPPLLSLQVAILSGACS